MAEDANRKGEKKEMEEKKEEKKENEAKKINEEKAGEKKEEKKETYEMSEKEKRIRAITKFYYSNPKVQEALLKFAFGREVVPRYFEGFGKRPDALQYPSDVMGMVNKGATSFHASEEIWKDPLAINSEMSAEEMNESRKFWDLLIDIDSQYLDYSKIAAKLIIEELEKNGIKSYGAKFSGSKGFHIIVPSGAFPAEFNGIETKKMFPEWARAICSYLMARIKREYSRIIKEKIDFESLKLRTNLRKEDVMKIFCPECGKESKKGKAITLVCPDCNARIKRANPRITKKGVRCINCTALMDIEKEEEAYYCENCNISTIDKLEKDDKTENTKYASYAREIENSYREDFNENIADEVSGGLDLVLVAPRHLFRMPYSLHEKTALASIVLSKEEIDDFIPQNADPMKIKIRDFMPAKPDENEGRILLARAIEWKKTKEEENERAEKEKYSRFSNANFESGGKKRDFGNFEIKQGEVKEEMFPKPIKKLLKGVKDGKKRGLFILLTFLKSLNFSAEYINDRVRVWNKLNEQPLKENYLKAQIEWHLRQNKKIIPPNYNNEAFYKDIGLIDEMPETKNPLVDVVRILKRNYG